MVVGEIPQIDITVTAKRRGLAITSKVKTFFYINTKTIIVM